MVLKCRLTHNLAEIKVDEIEVTLFKSHPQEIDDMISNLLDIVDDLKKLKGEPKKIDHSKVIKVLPRMVKESFPKKQFKNK